KEEGKGRHRGVMHGACTRTISQRLVAEKGMKRKASGFSFSQTHLTSILESSPQPYPRSRDIRGRISRTPEIRTRGLVVPRARRASVFPPAVIGRWRRRRCRG